MSRQHSFNYAFAAAIAILSHAILIFPACATDAILHLDVDVFNKTWAVSVVASNSSTLGFESFTLDVLGSGGFSILKNNPVSLTNQAPSAFSDLRTTGTISGTNLLDIHATQPLASAFTNDDPSFLTFNLGQPGAPISLAKGFFAGSVGSITAQVNPGGFFQFFPNNYDTQHPGDPAPGKVSHVINANVVVPAIFLPVPEPSSVVLIILTAIGVVPAGYCGRRAQSI